MEDGTIKYGIAIELLLNDVDEAEMRWSKDHITLYSAGCGLIRIVSTGPAAAAISLPDTLPNVS
jgi:hypothetical protein